jgi:hypothetical protein
VYFEADGSVPFGSSRVRGVWHAGVARSGARQGYVYVASEPGAGNYYRRGHYEYRASDRTHVDVRAGVAITTPACDVQLTWQHVDDGESGPYAMPWHPRDRAGWVVGCVKRW